MADPLSTAAAVLGVADIIIRSTYSLFKLISTIREASAEIRHLRQRLSVLEKVVMHVKGLRSTYIAAGMFKRNRETFQNIDLELELCSADLHQLEQLLAQPAGKSNTKLNRFGKVIKTVFAEDQIEKIARRIETRKLSVSILLQVLSSHNTLRLHEKLDTLQTGHDTIHQTLSRNEDVLRDICVKTDTTNEQLASFSQLADSKLSKLDHVYDFLLPVLIARGSRGNSNIIISGSAERAASSFPLVLPFLPRVFKFMNRQHGSPILSKHDIWWLEQEFNNLYLAVLREASQELAIFQGQTGVHCHRKSHSHDQPPYHQRRNGIIAEHPQGQDNECCSGNINKINRVLAARQTRLDTNIFPGRLIVSISESTPDACFTSPERIIDRVDLQFFPRPELLMSGLAVTASYTWKGGCSISPTLSTFGVITVQHSIWGMIESGDIDGVKRLLGKGLVRPSDRDAESGNSILAWAAWNYQIEICQLLIQQGADVLNCDTDNSSVLSVFLQAIRHNHTPLLLPTTSPSSIPILTRTLTTATAHSSLTESDRHIAWNGTTTGTFSHSILHRFILETFPSWISPATLSACYAALETFLRTAHNAHGPIAMYHLVNERNGWGRTPLMTATFQVCLQWMPRVLGLLLRYGADAGVVDGDGEGVLGRLFGTLGGCDLKGLGDGWAGEMVGVVGELLERGSEASLVGEGEGGGWTPSDNGLTAGAWWIWCEGLERAGVDLEGVIRREDERDGVVWEEEELEEMYRIVVNGGGVVVDDEEAVSGDGGDGVQEKMTCHLCNSQMPWRPRRRPFDLLGSYSIPGSNYHRPLHNHPDGGFCANYVVGGISACGAPEGEHDKYGYPLWPTTEEFSWRKHVAYRLFKEGVLGNSMTAALRWAMSDGG